MSGKKGKKIGKVKENDISGNRVNEILDDLVAYVLDSPQLDSYFKEKISEISEIEKEYLPIVTKRFLNAGSKEREVLLEFIKHMSGIEHINFLQKFVKNEVFLPKTGTKILDIFNKSDLIIDGGVASELLELENLTQRIKHAVLSGGFDDAGENEDALVQDFFKTRENEKKGIITEIIEDTGIQALTFMVKTTETKPDEAENIIKILASLSEDLSVKLLEGIYKEIGSKDVQKVIKRTVHALKQKGISITLDAVEEETTSVLKKAELPDTAAYSSIIDAEGHRFIFVVKPVTAHENKIFNILVSDVTGIKEIEVMTSMRKEAKVLVEKILSDKKTEFFEIAIDYASFIIDEARMLSEKNGQLVSANIAQWDSFFSDQKSTRQETFIYDLIKKDEISEKELSDDDINGLFEKKDMTFWFLTSDYAKEQWVKITDILKDETDSDQSLNEDRIKALREESCVKFFDDARINSFKRRLEEVAYYFYIKNYKDMALSSLRAAGSLLSPDMKPEDNIFCKAVVNSGFDYFISAYEDEIKKRAEKVSG